MQHNPDNIVRVSESTVVMTRTSPMTGKQSTLELRITQGQWDNYKSGQALIQHALPDLSPAEREFVKTGYTEADWVAIFGPGDEEEDEEDPEPDAERAALDAADRWLDGR